MTHVLIVEDLPETADWLTGIVRAAFPDVQQLERAACQRAGLQVVSRQCFDLALIDLCLPDGSGIELLKLLRELQPACLCVVTTVLADDAHVVAALSAGAGGYLLKEQPRELIIRQLAQLADGVPALSPSIARRIMEHFQRTGPAVDTSCGLTTRERDVLALISRGLRNIDVAGQLQIAENTVAHHIKSIYRKLGISSRAEAAWHATRLGLAQRSGQAV